jgi:hypothetical protein
MTKHIPTYKRTTNVQKLDERMKENLLQNLCQNVHYTKLAYMNNAPKKFTKLMIIHKPLFA